MLARDCLHITSFLRQNIQPYKSEWKITYYPCSAILKDGLEIPRVLVGSEKEIGNHYLSSLKPENDRGEPYRSSMLRAWVTTGNRISVYDIAEVKKSRYALPGPILELWSAMGEVAMGSNQCIATMKDGVQLPLIADGPCPFFDFPTRYTGDDVVSIRRTRHDSSESVRGLFSFNTYVTWPEEDERDPDAKNLI